MGVGQLSESDAVDALRLPFYSSRHARGSHVPGNQFDQGNTSFFPINLCIPDLSRRLHYLRGGYYGDVM